jgi:hypothetical protein
MIVDFVFKFWLQFYMVQFILLNYIVNYLKILNSFED